MKKIILIFTTLIISCNNTDVDKNVKDYKKPYTIIKKYNYENIDKKCEYDYITANGSIITFKDDFNLHKVGDTL